MKILRLDLLAFGHFTSVDLDLSRGDHAVQLIHGPNEAGKSTALRALRALFYGIDARSPDGFLHEYDKLRIGAVVETSSGEKIDFIRRKGLKNTFLDRDGKPADETGLLRCLNAVNEEQFTSFFGINHERLVAGGQSMLRGGGNVGQSLFSAGLGGGASLRDVLGALESEAAELFKPQGQNQAINRACREYAEAKREIAAASLPGRDYEERLNALTVARAERERLRDRLRELTIETKRFERIARALKQLPQRRALREELEQLGDVVPLPPEFSEERSAAMAARENAAAQEQRSAQKIEELKTRIAALQIPEQLMERADLVGEMHQRLGSHRKAALDLPGLEAQLHTLNDAAAALLQELRPGATIEEAKLLRISRVQQVKIQELASREQAVSERCDAAGRTLKQAAAELEAAEKALQLIGDSADAAELRSAVHTAQKQGDLIEELSLARTNHAQLEATAARDLKRLGLWTGSLAELESYPAPSGETIARFETDWGESENTTTNLMSRIAEAEQQAAQCEREIEALLLTGSVPAESDLAAARMAREEGWQLIRSVWLERKKREKEIRKYAGEASLDSAYEARVAAADELADRLRREADAVSKRANLIAAHEQRAAEAKTFQSELAACRSSRQALEMEWKESWPGLTPLPPREMRAWLQKQDRLVAQAETLRHSAATITSIEQRIATHQNAIATALAAHGEKVEPLSLNALLDRAVQLLDTLDQAAQTRTHLRNELQKLSAKSAAAAGDREEAQRLLETWRTEWRTAILAAGLAADASPVEAHEFIAGCAELQKKLSDAAELRTRISAIQAEAAAFIRETANACAQFAPDLVARPVEEAVAALHARLSKAEKDAATLEALTAELATATAEFDRARDAGAAAARRLEEMCRQAHCPTPEELEPIEQKSRTAQALHSRLDAIDERLLAESGALPVEEFIAGIAELNPDELQAELADELRRLASLDEERSRAEQEVGVQETLLRAMDGNARAAEAAEQAQAALGQVEEHADRYIRLRLGAAILRREIERYRAENQDPLLRRAGEFFHELTLGSFTGVTTDFDANDQPVLRGVRPSGAQVPVEGMSDGTRDQLFLGLQLASVEKFIAACEPMPFIVDDVLIAFDQEREAAVLQVLSELAKKTQVIVFTHHRHLVELARKTLGERVVVHELAKA